MVFIAHSCRDDPPAATGLAVASTSAEVGTMSWAYKRCRQILQQQIDTDPSPRTRAALADLLR